MSVTPELQHPTSLEDACVEDTPYVDKAPMCSSGNTPAVTVR